MKAGKGTAETLRRIIAIFQSRVDYPNVRRCKFAAGQSEPPHSNIVSQRKAAQDAEHPLKMKAGRIGLLRRFFIVNGFHQMGFHVVQRPLYPGDPIHCAIPFRVIP